MSSFSKLKRTLLPYFSFFALPLLCVVKSVSAVSASDSYPLTLGQFATDLFYVAQVRPEEINIARGYSGNPDLPADKDAKTNLHSETLLSYQDPYSIECDTFSFKSWNDWRNGGLIEGEAISFGHWNTPVEFLGAVGSDGQEGVIALPVVLDPFEVFVEGKVAPEIAADLLRVRTSYLDEYRDWATNRTFEVLMLRKCSGFAIYRLKMD